MAIMREALQGRDPKKLDIETFGEIVDEALKKNEVRMAVVMEKDSLEPEIMDNVGGGPVMQLYMTMHILKKVLDDTWTQMKGLDPDKKGDFLDEILEIIKDEVLEGSKEKDNE